MQTSNKTLVKNFSHLAFALLFTKILGGLYRVPLANFLGVTGVGEYQMVFPFFTMLLTLTQSMPSVIAKLVISQKDPYKQLEIKTVAKRYLILIGIITTTFLIVFSNIISNIQGNSKMSLGYILIAPSLFFVSLICYYRGLSQSQHDMEPTAKSQIIEQVTKIALGLFAIYILRNTNYAIFGAIAAVTLSEIIAVLFLKKTHTVNTRRMKTSAAARKTLLAIAIPQTLLFAVLPLTKFLESHIIISTLGRTEYGLFAGCAQTITAIPIALVGALATSLVPQIASSSKISIKAIIEKTLPIILLCAIGIFFLAKYIVNILYVNFDIFEKQYLIQLLKVASIVIPFHSVYALISGAMLGKGLVKQSLFSLLIGLLFYVIIIFTFTKTIGFYAIIISEIALFSVTIFLNIYKIKR